MARTVAQVVATARTITQDQLQPYRVPDSELVGYVSEAVGEARRVRPDLFLSSFRDTIPYYTESLMATTYVSLPDMYFAHLVNYVAGRADLREDEFSQDGRAMALMNAFGVALTGGKR